MTKARNLSDLLDATGDVVSSALDNVPPSDNASSLTTGTLPVARLADGSITSAKLGNDAKVVKSSTQPSNPVAGDIWYDTSNRIMKFYDSNDSLWKKISSEPCIVSSITGNIYDDIATTLTVAGTGFLSQNVTVNFTQASDAIDVDVVVTNNSPTTFTVDVPSTVYNNVTLGNVVSITVQNSDLNTSGAITKTVLGLPTGGTVNTVNGYRVHVFTSSNNFVIPSGYSNTYDALLVAGGGGGGLNGGSGGGAGGLIFRPSLSKSAGTYAISIGAGGQGRKFSQGLGDGASGSDTTGLGLTAKGGGFGDGYDPYNAGGNGGSGGGGGTARSTGTQPSQAGDSGTYGYGTNGGQATQAGNTYGGGGGGAGVGGSSCDGGAGGDGLNQVTQSGTTYNFATMFGTTVGEILSGEAWFAGGGSANAHSAYNAKGGGGYLSPSGSSGQNIPNSPANTGGGGGGINSGGNPEAGDAGNGGSGVVIIRYQL